MQLRMHLLCGLRGRETRQRLPELRRRFCAAADPAIAGMAAGRMERKTAAIRQARSPQICARRCNGALRATQRHSAGAALDRIFTVIASQRVARTRAR